MKPWIAKRIRDAGVGLQLQDDYSGRGMYGETTHSITGDMKDFLVAAAYAAVDLADAGPRLDEYMSALRSVRTDSMGREVVFY